MERSVVFRTLLYVLVFVSFLGCGKRDKPYIPPAVPPVSKMSTSPMSVSADSLKRIVPAPTSLNPSASSVVKQDKGLRMEGMWKFGKMVVQLRRDGTLHLKGGKVQALAPDGIEGTYTIQDTVFEISAMGAKKSGTYDGTTLTLEGIAGVRQP